MADSDNGIIMYKRIWNRGEPIQMTNHYSRSMMRQGCGGLRARIMDRGDRGGQGTASYLVTGVWFNLGGLFERASPVVPCQQHVST